MENWQQFRSSSGPAICVHAERDFDMRDLYNTLSQFHPATLNKLQWSLAPLEYLARRRGQKQLLVGSLQVSLLLPHIPFLLDYCKQLVADSTHTQAQAAASKSATFISHLLAVLRVAAVREKLGSKEVQSCVELLEAELATFQQLAGQQSGPAAATQLPPTCNPQLPGQPAAEPAFKQGQHTATGGRTTTTSSNNKGLHLSALLSAIAPYAGQRDSPFPPDFEALLSTWARLVYGELADFRSIQVAPLLLYHWRTLLRYLRLCLLGAATPAGSPGPLMPINTAVSHVQGLLHLLQYDSVRALYSQQQYTRVVDRLAAFRTILQGLPQPATGCPPDVHGFCSAAVVALLEQQASGKQPAVPGPSAGVQAAAVSASSDLATPGLELSLEQQQVLSLVQSQVQSGALTAQQLETLQELLAVLKRQATDDGSNKFEATLLPEGV